MLTQAQVIVASLVMLAVGSGVIYYLMWGKGARAPKGAIEWAALSMSGLLSVCAGLLLFLALAGGFVMTPGHTDSPAEQIGEPAGDFSFVRMESGEQGRLSDFHGKVVLVNLWATWCAPCLEEIPALNRLQDEYRDEGLVVLSVSDEGPDVLEAFADKWPLQTVSAYLDDEDDLKAPFILNVRPTSYVVDRNGILRDAVKGARDYAYFEQSVRPYL